MPPKPPDVRAGTFHIFTHCIWAVLRLYRDDIDRLELLRHLARAVKPKFSPAQRTLRSE
jgi:hypothetical protein